MHAAQKPVVISVLLNGYEILILLVFLMSKEQSVKGSDTSKDDSSNIVGTN